jgi:DNA repair exonuclease SbcCD ATPase subunit
LYSYQLKRTVYFIDNKTERTLDLYLDYRFTPGWELEEPETAPTETSAHFYRFRLEATAHQTTRFTVTERGENRESIGIGNLERQQLQLWFDSRFIDDVTRRSLEEILRLKETITELEERIAQAGQTIQTIFQNQERLRQNLQALGTAEDEKTLRERYVGELNKDEDTLAEARAEIERRRAEKQSLQQHLSARMKKFRYEGKPVKQ